MKQKKTDPEWIKKLMVIPHYKVHIKGQRHKNDIYIDELRDIQFNGCVMQIFDVDGRWHEHYVGQNFEVTITISPLDAAEIEAYKNRKED